MSTFKEWYENADMPQQDENGNWYDLEDGLSFDSRLNTAPKKQAEPKHPLAYLKLAELHDRCNSLQRGQKNAADKHRGALDVTKSDEVVTALDTLLASKKRITKAQLLSWIDSNAEASKALNKQVQELKNKQAQQEKQAAEKMDYSMFNDCENRAEIIEDLEKGSDSALWHEIGKSNGASNRRPSGITAKVKKELVLEFFAKNPQHEGPANAAASNKRMKALKELEAIQDGVCDFKWWVGDKEDRIYANVTAHDHALRFCSAYFDPKEKKFFGEEEVARMLESAMKKVGLI